LALALVASGLLAMAQEESGPRALLLELRGPIGPAISDFVERGIERAHAEGAEAVVLHIDTPGGLDTSMRLIIKAILASPVPIVSYVAPSGSRAASAGTFILYASHVAAMAPATNLGAATPVPIGPGALPTAPGRSRDEESRPGEDDAEPAPPDKAMARKIVNDAVAYIRGLAKLRGRNADWAEKAVRGGASLTAVEALDEGVIDLIADDVDALLAKLNGREVVVQGEKRTLAAAQWQMVAVEPDWRSRFLAVLTNPNVAYVLMMLGVYGLLFEIYSPGALVPGIVGAICLLLALYAFHVLPVNYAGLALILVGLGLMAAELFTPSLGAMGAGGVIAFVVGSIILMDTDAEGLEVSMPLVVTVSVTAAALFFVTATLALRQRRRPVVTGREQMIGDVAEALEPFSSTGRVRVHGEIWWARVERPVTTGETLRITALDGLTLVVEPPQEKED
jgi:membrane-bound serine protease (ClpP class)